MSDNISKDIILKDIEKYENLVKAGVITSKEFEEHKKEILGNDNINFNENKEEINNNLEKTELANILKKIINFFKWIMSIFMFCGVFAVTPYGASIHLF